jgi:hypothetical protein
LSSEQTFPLVRAEDEVVAGVVGEVVVGEGVGVDGEVVGVGEVVVGEGEVVVGLGEIGEVPVNGTFSVADSPVGVHVGLVGELLPVGPHSGHSFPFAS